MSRLESPCLPHLESHHDKPNGHVLLASAALMGPHPHRHASSTSPVSSPHDPAVIFDRLLALSKHLVSEDTLSPVQAWSFILGHPMVSSLDKTRTKQLSASLLEIVKCYGYVRPMMGVLYLLLTYSLLRRLGLALS